MIKTKAKLVYIILFILINIIVYTIYLQRQENKKYINQINSYHCIDAPKSIRVANN